MTEAIETQAKNNIMAPTDQESQEIKHRISSYWSKRSHDFADLKIRELEGYPKALWQAEISKYLEMHYPGRKGLRVLDVGCGSGFFSIILTQMGHEVTGIDLTLDMVAEAGKTAEYFGLKVDYRAMDAEKPDFPDETFDLIISRNLTWTLPHTGKAYKEWIRCLKPGGILLNFDADYGNEVTENFAQLPTEHTHNMVGRDMMRENDLIKAQLEISGYLRPGWDVQTLLGLGLNELQVDGGISSRLFPKVDVFYNPTPMFCICGKKTP